MSSFSAKQLSLCLLSLLASCGSSETPINKSTSLDLEEVAPDSSTSHASAFQVGQPGARFIYSDFFSRSIIFSPLEQGVDVFTREIFDETSYNWQVSFTTSFGIERVNSRSSEEYVVAGFDELTGETVIEGWKFQTKDGGYFARRLPGTAAPVGTPSPLSVLDVDILGNDFIPPASRVAGPPPQKVVLFRGAGFRVRELLVDPEGRFILILDDVTGGVYQLINQQMTLLADAQTYPGLRYSDDLAYFQSGSQDRVVGLWMGGAPDRMLTLYDSENDGNFESISMLSLEDFNITFPFLGWNGIPASYVQRRY